MWWQVPARYRGGMDPISEVSDDAVTPSDARPVPAAPPIDAPLGVETASPVDASAVEGGNLAETESLLGAVMAADPDGEAASLRRTLELDDRPPTSTPTREEDLQRAADLRRAVTAEATSGGEAGTDPTERYEVHDTARGGDPLAVAIDETANAQLAARADAERADQRDDVVLRQEQVPAATDRASQDAGAAAATQAGAGRPAPTRAKTDVEDETEDERIERVEGLDAGQRIRAVGSNGSEDE